MPRSARWSRRSCARTPSSRSVSVYGHIKSPVEMVVGAIRQSGAQVGERALLPALQSMGQDLLNPPNVAGWAGDGPGSTLPRCWRASTLPSVSPAPAGRITTAGRSTRPTCSGWALNYRSQGAWSIACRRCSAASNWPRSAPGAGGLPRCAADLPGLRHRHAQRATEAAGT